MVLAILNLEAAVAVAGAPSAKTESLRGRVFLIRRGKLSRVMGETVLRAGDWVDTGADSTIRVVADSVSVDLAQESLLEVTSKGLALRYGVFRAKVAASRTDHRARRWILPSGLAETQPQAEPSEYLFVIMRNESALNELFGGTRPRPPKLAEVKKLAARPEMSTWIAAMSGAIHIKPVASDGVILRAGETMRIHGKDGDFAATPASTAELSATRETIGFSP